LASGGQFEAFGNEPTGLWRVGRFTTTADGGNATVELFAPGVTHSLVAPWMWNGVTGIFGRWRSVPALSSVVGAPGALVPRNTNDGIVLERYCVPPASVISSTTQWLSYVDSTGAVCVITR
jgi:hypothetical protein